MKNQKIKFNRRAMTHTYSVMILLLILAGCDHATSPNQDLSNSYDIPVPVQSGDAINSAIDEQPIYTVEGFYFLAPMVKDSEYSGTFDAGLSPVVEICETTACATIHESFDMDADEAIGLVDGRTLPVKFRIETSFVGSEPEFFLVENGITIRCPDTEPGQKGMVYSVEYEAIDRNLLIRHRDQGTDLPRLCTTPVTDMSEMFTLGAEFFNQDLSRWCLSNIPSIPSGFDLFCI